MESVGDYAILISSVMLSTTQHKRSIGKLETDNSKTTDTMIIPTTESTLRMTLMQLSETKLELTAVTEQRDRLAGGLKWIAGWNHQLFDENTAMQMRDKAEQALQSLNPDHTVDVNDMIANQPTKP